MKLIKYFLTCSWACLILAIPWQVAFAQAPENLSALYESARGGEGFYQPEKEEMQRARRLFGAMMQGSWSKHKEEKPNWDSLGFRTLRTSLNGKSYIAVVEAGDKKGRGLYLVAANPDKRTALMIPHGMKDLHTAKIGMQMLKQGNFVAAAFNTVPRYKKKGGEKLEQDMAHSQRNYFLSFTRAFADVFHNGRLVQIHGFAQKNRDTVAGKRADIILSNGSPVLLQGIFDIAKCLRRDLSYNVAVYPLDVSELGGTTNTSGNALQKMGHPGFVHLEMYYQLRKRMLNKDALLKKVLNCLELGQ